MDPSLNKIDNWIYYIDDDDIITISTTGSNINLIGYAIFSKELKYSLIYSE